MNLTNFSCDVYINTEKPFNIKFIYNSRLFCSILDALENYNILVNYQCKSGYCGSCKSLLKKGNVQYFTNPLASCILSEEILICCCYPIDHIILII